MAFMSFVQKNYPNEVWHIEILFSEARPDYTGATVYRDQNAVFITT